MAYSSNSARGAQNYMSCVQIKVTSSGTLSLPGGSTFPGSCHLRHSVSIVCLKNVSLIAGAYTDSTQGIIWNLYAIGTNPSAYQAPGPGVWSGSAGGSIGLAGPPTTPTTTAGSSDPTSPSGTVALYDQCGGVSRECIITKILPG